MAERLLILGGLVLAVIVVIVAGRLLARRRLARLRRTAPTDLWTLLGLESDGRATVVAFSTPSCAACHSAQRPALVRLQENTAGAVRVVHVDAAERPEVAQAFGVLTVPATVVLDPAGRVQAANQGFAPAHVLEAQIGLTLTYALD